MAAENAAKSRDRDRQVSTMIKHGFIHHTDPPPPPFSPSTSTTSSPSHSYLTPPAQTHSPTHHPQPQTTLFEMMMSGDQTRHSNLSDDNRRRMRDRVSKLLEGSPIRGGGGGGGDVRVTVVGRDGVKVAMEVHKRVLLEKSRFFAQKLLHQSGGGDDSVTGFSPPQQYTVEISECESDDDVEVYVEAVVLMYCDDIKKRLMGRSVSNVLSLLKVSAAIKFDLGVVSCLEYLEAIPWTEDEQDEVISQLGHLQLHDDSATEVLLRVSPNTSTPVRADNIFMSLLSGVLQAKDEKARREMKSLLSRLLKEDSSNDSSRLDVSKDTLYHLCHGCIGSLAMCLSEASSASERPDRGVLMSEIAREADNIQWIVDILIGKKMGDEFVKIWADQEELAALHSKVPTIYRHEISRITAQLCIGIGRGHILVPKETRFSLLSTWLEALYEDFGWMRRASRAVDKKSVEDGLSQTILTLPLLQQQKVLLNWFDRFLNKGDDIPNIQKGFEIWWRRAFIRKYSSSETDNSKLQIALCGYQS